MSTEKKTKAKSTGTKKTAEKVSAPEELKPYKYEDEHFVDSSRKVWNYSLLTEEDVKNFQQGTHYRLYEKMGSHAIQVNGIWGMYFAVWAPNATGVSVKGNFNDWTNEDYILLPRWDKSVHSQFQPG
jgi:1,4-alpha-glucan branching enzyme